MTIEKALPYLKEHQQELINRILRGKYTPSPVRRVEIPKPDGGVRKLGIQEKRLIEKGRYIRMGYEYDSKGRVTTFHNPNGNDVAPLSA